MSDATLELTSLDDLLSDLLVEEAVFDEEEVTTGDDEIVSPFDPNLLRVQPRILTIDLLLTRILENELDLTPGFQRKAGIWTPVAQSRLIESLLIRIPLPSFYFDATDDDRWLVIDGLQRLTSLRRFVLDGSLKLRGLEFLGHLHGKSYSDLPRNLQRRIKEAQIIVYSIERGTPPEVKFNVFRRINTGGLPLSPQEIRHALYQGRATRLLAELADSSEFQHATRSSISDSRMNDRECALRFLAFTMTPYHQYRSEDFDRFLNNAMTTINHMDDSQVYEMGNGFRRAMRIAADTLGSYAFRKVYELRGRQRQISKPLFEAWSVNLAQLSDDEAARLHDRRQDLLQRYINLMHDREFEAAVTLGTGTVARVQTRFREIGRIISEALR